MKKLLVALAVLVVIVAAALLFLARNLDAIVEVAIERIASRQLGVPVTVGSVDLELREGRGTILDLVIANPDGYSDEAAFAIGELTLDVEVATDTVRLARAAEPRVRIEVVGETNNFETLLARSQKAEPPPPAETEVTTEEGEPAVITVERIEIEAVEAQYLTDRSDRVLTLPIRQLVFTDLHGTSEEIADQVLEQLLGAITEAIRSSAGRLVEAVVDEAKERVETKVENTVEQVKEGVSAAVDEAATAVRDAAGELKSDAEAAVEELKEDARESVRDRRRERE
ncbi:MAG: hypothetical protein R3190_00600 [Thermoanaerobaculia bacterium]|nr:hypothetical protein [Thermoanaerobaculia bacterium]